MSFSQYLNHIRMIRVCSDGLCAVMHHLCSDRISIPVELKPGTTYHIIQREYQWLGSMDAPYLSCNWHEATSKLA